MTSVSMPLRMPTIAVAASGEHALEAGAELGGLRFARVGRD